MWLWFCTSFGTLFGLKEINKYRVTLWYICNFPVSAMGSGTLLLSLIHSFACQAGQTWKWKSLEKGSHLIRCLFWGAVLHICSSGLSYWQWSKDGKSTHLLTSQECSETATFQTENWSNWQKVLLFYLRIQAITGSWTILRTLLKLNA